MDNLLDIATNTREFLSLHIQSTLGTKIQNMTEKTGYMLLSNPQYRLIIGFRPARSRFQDRS